MGRHTEPKPLPPDDPIYREGLTIFTPLWARPGYKPPEPKTSDEPDETGKDPSKKED